MLWMGLRPEVEDEVMATPATNGEPRERLWWLGDLLEVVEERTGLGIAVIGVSRGGGHGGDGGHKEL